MDEIPEYEEIVLEKGEIDCENEVSNDDQEQESMLQFIQPHNGDPIYAIAVHPFIPAMFATGGGDDVCKLFVLSKEAQNIELVAEMEGHTDSIDSLAFSPNGKYLASGGLDGTVRVWNGQTGKFLYCLEASSDIAWMRWSPDSRMIAAGTLDGLAWIWEGNDCRHVFGPFAVKSLCGCFTPQGDRLVVGGIGMVIVVDVDNGATLLTYNSSIDRRFPDLEFISIDVHPTRNIALLGNENGSAVIINFEHFSLGNILKISEEPVESVAFSNRLALFVTACMSGDLSVWDSNTLSLRHRLGNEEFGGITKMILVDNEDFILTGHVTGTVNAWNLRSGQLLSTSHSSNEVCLALAYMPREKLTLASFDNGSFSFYSN